MYMRMPMSNSTLPVHGACVVDDKSVTLKFPFTGISFELPRQPEESCNDYDFTIKGQRGEMNLTIGYIKELQCFAISLHPQIGKTQVIESRT